jgi:hypothetical protein
MIATTSSGQQLPKQKKKCLSFLFFSLVEKDDDYLHTPLFLLNMSGVITILKKKNTVALKGFFFLAAAATLQVTLHN